MNNREDILAKWLDGKISDKELEALEGSDALKEMKRLKGEVDQWSMPKYNTDAGLQKMKKRLKDEAPKNDGSKRNKLIIIAIAILAVMLLYGLIASKGNKKEELKAAPGEEINYAFQDGSEVWLNDGSSIEYKKSDWSTQRTIALKGEALFEVSKGSPFTVNTPNGKITVLGTQFNVRTWGDNLYVECYEGKVQVQSGTQRIVLTAKEGINIIHGSMKAKQSIKNIAPVWQNDLSRFYDDKLKIVCQEIERQYQIKVDLRVADRIFSGQFRHDDLDRALQSICKPLGLSYMINQDKKTVVIE